MRKLRAPLWVKRTFLLLLAFVAAAAYCQKKIPASSYHFNTAPIHTIALITMGDKRHIAEYLEEKKALTTSVVGELYDPIPSFVIEKQIMILQNAPSQKGEEFKLRILPPCVEIACIEKMKVRIISMKGRLIKRLSIKRDGTVIFDGLYDGDYMIEAIWGNSRRIQKLIKK